MKYFITLAIILSGCLKANAAGDTARVLFIGNSYTHYNDLPEIVRQLAAANGDVLVAESVAPGGAMLMTHSTSEATLTKIDAGTWDYVVLQEQSQAPAFPDAQVAEDVYPYAAFLSDRIRTANPCTRIVFFNTWGYKNGDGMNCPFFEPLCTYEDMDSMLRLRYGIMAAANNAWIAPAGPVRRRIRTLHPGLELYQDDGSHPTPAGSYAAACAFYSMLFGKPAADIPYNFSLPAADAATIRNASDVVAFDSLAYWRQHYTPPPAPTAAFAFSTSGLSATFTNASSDAAGYEWHFGDGTTATTTDAAHTYSAPGTYTVVLKVQGECSAISADTQLITISGVGIATTTIRLTELCCTISGNILIANNSNDAILRLYNMLGQEQVLNWRNMSEAKQADVSALASGLYMLDATMKDGSHRALKIIKP